MEGYQVATVPFCESLDPSVTLLKAIILTEDRLPVIIKRFDFVSLQLKATQQSLTQAINAAIIQAKTQHPHAREIREVRFDLEENRCSLYHVLESGEHDLAWEIAERRKQKKPFSEEEMHTFLRQIASLLVYTHSKVLVT